MPLQELRHDDDHERGSGADRAHGSCVEEPLKKIGAKKLPRLEIIHSPFRRIHQPILDLIEKLKQERDDNLVAVVIPELVQPRWWEYLLHNHRATGLKALLYTGGDDRTIVINRP